MGAYEMGTLFGVFQVVRLRFFFRSCVGNEIAIGFEYEMGALFGVFQVVRLGFSKPTVISFPKQERKKNLNLTT